MNRFTTKPIIGSDNTRSTISSSFGQISNNLKLVKVNELFLHDKFNGLAWCVSAYKNPNKANPSLFDIIYNLIDGNGQVFTCRQWGVTFNSDINALKNTPVNIVGVVISISDKTYYRLDSLTFADSAINLPKSLFIKELDLLNQVSQRVIEFLTASKSEYSLYLLNNLGYLDKFKENTYSENKGKFLGDKLSCLDFILSSINRFKTYGLDEIIMSDMATFYLCILQEMQLNGSVDYHTLLKSAPKDICNAITPVISLVNNKNKILYTENKELKVVHNLIMTFEEMLFI